MWNLREIDTQGVRHPVRSECHSRPGARLVVPESGGDAVDLILFLMKPVVAQLMANEDQQKQTTSHADRKSEDIYN